MNFPQRENYKAYTKRSRNICHMDGQMDTTGYAKKLEIVGVGYRAELQGAKINMNLGYSHPVVIEPVDGIKFAVSTNQAGNNVIEVTGIDKQVVGQVAAEIRSKRPPEPYKGKGVKYTGERIRRKAGKTGK